MPQEKKLNLRDSFMLNFVSHLISSSYIPEKNTTNKIKTKKVEKKSKTPQTQSFQKSIMHRPVKLAPPLATSISLKPAEKPPATVLAQKPAPPKKGIKQAPVNLGKIASILKDPAVLSVECRGPNKNILVNRSGAIQTSALVLSKEEINKIMNEVSDKTRIPIVPGGMFKAAFQDIIMTAVISEFVGTRFMIQKMTPFQQNQR